MFKEVHLPVCCKCYILMLFCLAPGVGDVNIVSNKKEKGGSYFYVERTSVTDRQCYLFREGVANSIRR